MAAKTFFRYLVRGCLVAAPLGLTVYIVYLTLKTIDGWLPVPVPGLGLLLTIGLLALIGFLTSNVVGRGVVELLDQVLQRVPLVKLVYTSIKDLIGAFVGDKKSFTHPCTLRIGDGPLKVLGFVTRDSLPMLGLPGHVAVYLPQSYNFAGNLIIAPNKCVEPLDVPSAELMTFIVSGGISGLGAGQSQDPIPRDSLLDGRRSPPARPDGAGA